MILLCLVLSCGSFWFLIFSLGFDEVSLPLQCAISRSTALRLYLLA